MTSGEAGLCDQGKAQRGLSVDSQLPAAFPTNGGNIPSFLRGIWVAHCGIHSMGRAEWGEYIKKEKLHSETLGDNQKEQLLGIPRKVKVLRVSGQRHEIKQR